MFRNVSASLMPSFLACFLARFGGFVGHETFYRKYL